MKKKATKKMENKKQPSNNCKIKVKRFNHNGGAPVVR